MKNPTTLRQKISCISIALGKAREGISINPDSSRSRLSISFNCQPDSHTIIRILTPRGRLVSQQEHPAHSRTSCLDVSGHPAGRYLINILCGSRIFKRTMVLA